jgi:hypothetical protein
MSDGNWRSNLAVAGGVAGGLLLAVWFSSVVAMGPAPGSIKPRQEDQKSHTEERPPASGSSPLRSQPPAGKQKTSCREDEKKEDCLQRRAVVAAEDQARAAEDQARYTWIGLILLLGTLWYTARSANIAIAALKASRRPWVGVVTVASDRAWVADQKMNASVVIQNTGQSPARDMRVSVKGCILRSDQERPKLDTSQAPPKALFPSVPDYYFPFLSEPSPSQAEINEIVAGTKIAWIIMRIDYFDEPTEPHYTNVCTRWYETRRAFVPHDTGNDAG